MSGTEFSLRGLIRQVRDDLGTGDTHRIAKEAAARISPADRDSAYLQGLTEVARAIVNSGHPQLRQAPGSTLASTPGAGAQASPPGSSHASKPGAGQRNSGRSSKVAAIRRTWPQLRATYACLDVNKQLGDYNADDLIFVASHLEAQAALSTVKAERFHDLSASLALHKVKKVRDLPDAVLAAAFLGEAA
jgi:hypothetical protein